MTSGAAMDRRQLFRLAATLGIGTAAWPHGGLVMACC
jgi:hypothetical protein